MEKEQEIGDAQRNAVREIERTREAAEHAREAAEMEVLMVRAELAKVTRYGMPCFTGIPL